MAISPQQKNSEKFRLRLRTRMDRLNLQANEVAEAMGVEPSALSNWMSGLHMPKGSNLRELARVLKCDPNWLVGLSEEFYPPHSSEANELKEAVASAELEQWKERALAAERQLDSLRAGLVSLVEASRRHSASSQAGGKPKPDRIPGVSSTVEEAAEAMLEVAEGIAAAENPGLWPKPPTGAPSAPKGGPGPTSEKD